MAFDANRKSNTRPGLLAFTYPPLLAHAVDFPFGQPPVCLEPRDSIARGRHPRRDLVSCIALLVFLQVLDFLTTVIGLRLGIGELSPFIRWLMRTGPVVGLLGAKMIGCALGVVCLWTGRTRVIVRMNCFFAGLVLWNLLMILRQIMK